MKIGDKKAMLINFIQTMLSDKDDKYYLVQPELTGNINISVGNDKKKKYQYINGDICIPHNLLKEEYKNNFDVISKFPLYIYGYLKKEYVNDTFVNYVDKSKDDLNTFLSDNPKVEKALNELLEALKESKIRK